MSKHVVRRSPAPGRRERGFVLVTGLLFLVILTVLGLALFRGTGLMDRISANTRDKQRSFEAAQAALQYGEWAIQNGTGGIGTACTNAVNSTPATNVHVCSNALAAPDTLPWPGRFEYTPPNMAIGTAGGLTSNGSDVKYQAPPGFYIEYKGLDYTGKNEIYQVTAYGYGGNADTGTVVRSTYQVTPPANSIEGP
jgi:type IV pilus assembly protein PilX